MTWTTSRQKPFVVPGPTSQIFQALDEFLKVDPGNPAARALLLEIETEELKRKAKRVGPGFAEAGRPGMARLGLGGGGSVGDRLGMGVGCFWLFLAWKEMEENLFGVEWTGRRNGREGHPGLVPHGQLSNDQHSCWLADDGSCAEMTNWDD